MIVIVIFDSDSDSEFKRGVQEANRRSLMTVAPSPVREVVSSLLAFPGEPRNETKLVISWK